MNEKFCEELDKIVNTPSIKNEFNKIILLDTDTTNDISIKLKISEAQESILQMAFFNYLNFYFKPLFKDHRNYFDISRPDATVPIFATPTFKANHGHDEGDVQTRVKNNVTYYISNEVLICDLKCASHKPEINSFHGGSVSKGLFMYPTHIEYIISCSLTMEGQYFKIFTFSDVKDEFEKTGKYRLDGFSCPQVDIDTIIRNKFSNYF